MRPDGNSRSRAMLLLLCGLLLTLGRTAGAQAQTFTSNTTITASNTKYENYDITVSGCTVTIDGKHSFHSLTVESSGIVTHDPQNSPNFAGGMNLNISTNCDIQIGCSINAVGMGWAGGLSGQSAHGPGAGRSDTSGNSAGGGGSYGGEALYGLGGGAGAGAVYDDLTLKTPTDLGSGGGSGYAGQYVGGNGGGAIQLTVGGTLQVDGAIIADGGNSVNYGGGGSGGSLYLMAGTLSGAGYLSASGGNSYDGGPGGGGRIAIYYTTNSFAAPLSASGYAIRAAGGYGSNYWSSYAAAGTVFLQQVGGQTQGDLWVHNQGNAAAAGASTPLEDALTFDNVYVWGQGVLASPYGSSLNLTVWSNVDVAVGGRINVSGRGYPGGAGGSQAHGPGAGRSDTSGSGYGGGGSYGGEALYGLGGGAGAGAVYDDLTLKTPTDLGSGGGSGYAGQYVGGNGGGAIQLTVGGTLQVDGAIIADGGNSVNYGGGGSGGSLYLMAGTLSGAGYLSASGGNSYDGGPGGGGRIAIYYTTNSFAAPLSASGYAIRAAGGYGSNYWSSYAAAGTVFLQQVGGQTQGDLWVHNQGNAAAAGASTPLEDALTFDNVYVWGQGVLASSYGSPLTLQVLGTLDIAVDGYLSATGRGYVGAYASRPAGGPGAGRSDVTGHYGGGGGYGGAGDVDSYGVNAGGATYGSAPLPTDLGSGGGSSIFGQYAGGNGGGAIHAIVNGTLQVDGQLRANGGSGGSSVGGGGSGGSLWLVTNTLSGAGIISASGGNTYYAYGGGGGGGGRIAIYTFTNNFANGTIAAPGGMDAGPGGSPGTVNVYPTSGVSLQAITLAATTLPEGQSTTGSVTLSGLAPTGGVTVTLTPSNSTVAQIPPSVTVPAGQQSYTFPITANPSATAGSVTLSAALGGVAQSVTLDVEPWIAAVALKPTAVPGGTTATGTVSLNFPAPLNGLPVNLASSNAAVATVLGSVTVPQGKLSATFTVSTSKSVASETAVTVSATYNAVESVSATLNVDPSGVALKAFTLSPAIVVGGNVCIGTVSLTGKAPAGGAVVALSSANPSPVLVPALLTIPQGQSSAAFVISTPQVIASQSASISATLGTVTKAATLKIQPTGVASLILAPTTVQGGVETAIGIVTLQSAVRTNTVVTIKSSSSYATPDTTVVIPAGALTGTFNIDTTTNATGKPIKAVITATANAIAKTATLTVN